MCFTITITYIRILTNLLVTKSWSLSCITITQYTCRYGDLVVSYGFSHLVSYMLKSVTYGLLTDWSWVMSHLYYISQSPMLVLLIVILILLLAKSVGLVLELSVNLAFGSFEIRV